KDVFLLKSILDTISISKTKFPFHLFQNSQLGDIENSFATFQKEFLANELNNKLKPYQIESNAQRLEFNHLKERLSLLESQKNITESELEIQKSDLERYEKLYKKDIIAAQELEKHRLQYLQAEKGFKALLSTISQLKSSLNELKRNSQSTQINEEKDFINLDRSLTQVFFALKKSLSDWELSYVLKSSISGKVSYLQLWSENQPVNTGDVVFSVIPSLKSSYIAKAKAPAANAGKLAAKQLVNIRLLNYPDREFGVINGFVQNIAATPDKDGNLLIDITLPQGLKTSYEKDIAFQQEMSGTGDIITKDLRLLERFLYQFRDMVRR
ncbi:HlyD family efflux transporter periplasmic adaptor subunit, partial [Flavobacterium aurantiibacter]